jgi:hypothetical protein
LQDIAKQKMVSVARSSGTRPEKCIAEQWPLFRGHRPQVIGIHLKGHAVGGYW